MYGATETSGAISRSTPGYNRLGAAGLVIEGIEVKIHNPNRYMYNSTVVMGALGPTRNSATSGDLRLNWCHHHQRFWSSVSLIRRTAQSSVSAYLALPYLVETSLPPLALY